jgi:hypothetical protein
LVETVHISICLLFQNGKENPETKGIWCEVLSQK